MRQRITYLLWDPEAFDPSQLTVHDDSLTVQSLNAAKEHRVTFSFSELPQELWRLLKQCHELHIRWASSDPYMSIAPFSSRVSSGLHVFFTPHQDKSADLLCPLLTKLFDDDFKCESPKDTFSTLPILSERFSTASTSQYYQPLTSLKNLVTYVQEKFCRSTHAECRKQAASLLSASYVDIDFDTISHTLVINAFWSHPPSGNEWNERIHLIQSTETIEVGVLNNESPNEPEELSLGGFLTVLGQDANPKATLFSFPSRHHPLPQDSSLTYVTSFKHPTGLHPTLQLHFSASDFVPPSTTAACSLHTYLILPSHLFIDKYQLYDPLFLSSHHLRQLRGISGEMDLEAPDWIIQRWGSSALLELEHPFSPSKGIGAGWNVTIPLHLRYLSPSRNSSGVAAAEMPWPVVFWACTAEEGSKMSVNPFNRVNLGYDGLFGQNTLFYHIPPAQTADVRLIEEVRVPVLDLDRAGYVEWGTVGVILLGAAWVCLKLFDAFSTSRSKLAGRRIGIKTAE